MHTHTFTNERVSDPKGNTVRGANAPGENRHNKATFYDFGMAEIMFTPSPLNFFALASDVP